MNTKGLSAGLLSVVLLGSAVLSACSKEEGGTAVQPGEPAGNKAVEITVTSQPKYPPNQVPNTYIQEVEKRFNMKWDYEAIPLTAGMEKYNVMFISGTYPDFIPNMNGFSDVKKWAAAGYLLPIGDYIDRLPTYRSLFSDDDWKMLLDFASVNGKLYTLPNVASNDPMTWIYRKDALEKAGISEFPKTTEELYEALTKLKAAYPDSVGVGVRGGTGNTGIKNLLSGFAQAFRNPKSSNGRGFWNDPDANNQVVYSLASNKHREMLIYLAKLYKEGLIDKEFATITQDQWKQKRLTGKVLLDFQWTSHTVDPTYELKDIPGGRWDYSRNLVRAYEQPALEFKPMNFALFGPVFSSKLANQPEKLDKLIEYIEWASTEEGQLFHMMGIENVTYTNNNGVISYKDDLNRQKVAEQHGFDWMLKQSDQFLKTDEMYLKKQEGMKALADIYNVTPRSAALTDEESELINTTVSALEDVAYQFATKAVMGLVDASNDQVWNSYLADLEKTGLSKAQAVFKKYWE